MHLSHLQPESFFRFFTAISQIPRGSGNEKAVSDYIAGFAREKGLDVVQDQWHNLIIKKPAAPGYESHEPVILQGHLDMVCEKNNDTQHDFQRDPIKLVIDGDILRSDGTTLGADNGAAVAICMALLDDESLTHPPLEIVLTADEEAGMSGAENLDTSLLKGRRMINLDTSHEGIFYAGCAGGVKAAYSLPNQWEKPGGYTSALSIQVKGLKGGHSGEEISKERGNSLRILARLLQMPGKDIRIVSAQGGMKLNAIPREAEAVIAVEHSAKVKTNLEEFAKSILNEYRISDPGLKIIIKEAEADRVLAEPCGKNLINALLLLPYGVSAMSVDIPGLVETSCNIGVLEQNDTESIIHIMPRSSVKSRIEMVKAQISALAAVTGAQLEYRNQYDPWEYNPQSPLRETVMEIYRGMYKKEPQMTTVHAGLECGIFSSKMPGLDIVSFGPNIWELHTPDEHMSVSSMKRVWELMLALLTSL